MWLDAESPMVTLHAQVFGLLNIFYMDFLYGTPYAQLRAPVLCLLFRAFGCLRYRVFDV